MCSNDCMRTCDENVQKSGRMGTGSCNMTMPPPTQPIKSSSFWPNKMVVVSPPHSPDIPSCDFFLSSRMKQDLKGRHFANIEKVQQELLVALDSIPLKILDNVTSSGSSARIAASSYRASTWKGTKVSNLYEYFK